MIDPALVHHWDDWCEFHQAHEHDTKSCCVLVAQLTKLARNIFLKYYVSSTKEGEYTSNTHLGKLHMSLSIRLPILGSFNTISRDFSSGGMTTSSQKCHA